jgi:hypothetical protein
MSRSSKQHRTPRPVFVIGSPRSGTSIVAWSLGQHPNLLPLEETGWIAKVAQTLGSAYLLGKKGAVSQLASMNITAPEFYAAFASAIDGLIASHGGPDSAFARSYEEGSPFRRYRSPSDPKTRWVDGTPEYSFSVYDLLQLFPEARFVHMLRDVREVANSLTHFDRMGSSARGMEAAFDEWYRYTMAAFEAERALGSDIVLRLRHADLVHRPEWALRRCLTFLGEPFNEDCLEPLEQVINTSRPDTPAHVPEHDVESVVAKAIGLSDQLLPDPEPFLEPDAGARGELAARSSMVLSGFQLPLDGPVLQDRPAEGFWGDLWVAGELSARFVAKDDISKVTVEGEAPAMGDGAEVTLYLNVNGERFERVVGSSEEIAWTVPCSVARRERVELGLQSSRTWSPKREGTSEDERDLVLLLKRLVFSG